MMDGCRIQEGKVMLHQVKKSVQVMDHDTLYIMHCMNQEIENLKQEIIDLKNRMLNRKKPANLLTKRENEVYRLLSEGKTNLFIAKQLDISEKTVKNHVSRIIKKLKVKNRTEAVILGYKLLKS